VYQIDRSDKMMIISQVKLQLQQTMHEKMQMQQQIEVDGVEGKQLPR